MDARVAGGSRPISKHALTAFAATLLACLTARKHATFRTIAGALVAMTRQGRWPPEFLPKTVMFGGDSTSGSFNDAWKYDGANWTQMTGPSRTLNYLPMLPPR